RIEYPPPADSACYAQSEQSETGRDATSIHGSPLPATVTPSFLSGAQPPRVLSALDCRTQPATRRTSWSYHPVRSPDPDIRREGRHRVLGSPQPSATPVSDPSASDSDRDRTRCRMPP